MQGLPLIPAQIKALQQQFPDVEIVVQPSKGRCFTDYEFDSLGIPMQGGPERLRYHLGVKAVWFTAGGENLFLFFHGQKQTACKNYCRHCWKKSAMIDYDTWRMKRSNRVILSADGPVSSRRTRFMDLRWADQWKSPETRKRLSRLLRAQSAISRTEYTTTPRSLSPAQGIKGPFFKRRSGFGKCNPRWIYELRFQWGGFTVWFRCIIRPAQRRRFDREEFHHHPELYKSNFDQYSNKCDLLINCIFLEPEKRRNYFRASRCDSQNFVSVLLPMSAAM